MSSFVPLPPYTAEELQKLYPDELQLQLVQVAGLHAYWPYCNAARRLTSTVMRGSGEPEWDDLKWRRRLETFGENDRPMITAGPDGSLDGICQPGELTDVGRKSTYALGQRLRNLYVEQLGFMPRLIADSDMIYLRATPVPRALESVQQAFVGFYPPSARTAAFPPPTIVTRSPADETLYPNDGVCRRFAELSRAFAERSANRWNDSEEMQYISSKIGKWMPEVNNGKVKVDSRPRLSGVIDTINATDAHGSRTKLPKEFYDERMRAYIDRISVEEWYSGYMESREYRLLGIGSLVADVVARMAGVAEKKDILGIGEIGGEGAENLGVGRGGERHIKFGMSGCHDTTLAATLASLGCYEGEKWPPFTSHIAFELFKRKTSHPSFKSSTDSGPSKQQETSLWSRFFGLVKKTPITYNGIGRTPLSELSASQKTSLEDHYVRVRYNDRIMKLPGCAVPGNHLEGNTSFCTLEAFKAIVDDFTPKNWKSLCAANIGKSAFPDEDQPAGHA